MKRIPAPVLVAAIVFVVLTLALVVAPAALGHTPRPVACDLAWQQAPVGSKHAARVACQRAQARHVADHRRAVVVAAATRRCLAVRGSGMGSGLCHAVATVRSPWATNRAYHELLRRESTWNPNAINDSSGACGAFQRLQMRPKPPCPWPVSGRGTRNERVYATPLVQTRNGVRYILGRYGSPERALAVHDAVGWY